MVPIGSFFVPIRHETGFFVRYDDGKEAEVTAP